jgi:2-amino-4-hydroxy-6-hydroxymethyldihydropteridine diphosphokinase
VRIKTTLEPLPLLHQLQSIENAMGRTRETEHWGPRVIDVDLLLMDGQTVHTAELDLPHPYMYKRAFVLLPLYELDPGLEIPGHGPIEELLAKLSCDGIHKLDQTGEV